MDACTTAQRRAEPHAAVQKFDAMVPTRPSAALMMATDALAESMQSVRVALGRRTHMKMTMRRLLTMIATTASMKLAAHQ
jgi:hypothetical protein